MAWVGSSLISNWYTFHKDTQETLIIIFIVFWCMWEFISGYERINDNALDGVEYKITPFDWRQISLIWGVYVSLKYYINPFLDKILKD